MKRVFVVLIVLLSLGFNQAYARHKSGGSHSKSSVVHVKGYTKKNGTYVSPHYQTSPNGTQRDNWSAKGNANPYTGKIGTKEPTH